MDLLDQFAGAWRRRFLILSLALTTALLIFVWRSSAPEEYVATTTLQVRIPATETSDPSARVDYYARTVLALATNRSVLETALAAAGRTETPDEVADNISAEEGLEPGFVEIAASGTSPDASAVLANEIAAALTAEIKVNQADDLAAEREALRLALAEVAQERNDLPPSKALLRAALKRESEALVGSLRAASGRVAWQLVSIQKAQAPSTPESPKPLRDALLAFILAVIILSEIIILRRAWRGELSLRDPAGDAREVVGVPAVAIDGSDGPAALASLLPRISEAETVTVLHWGRQPSAAVASLLAELLAEYDERVLIADAGTYAAVHYEFGLPVAPGLSDAPAAKELPSETEALRAALAVRSTADDLDVLPAGSRKGSADGQRLESIIASGAYGRVVIAASVVGLDEVMPSLTKLTGPVVLDIEPGAMTRQRLRSEIAALDGLGVEVIAVVVRADTGPLATRLAHRQAVSRRAATLVEQG